MSLRTSVAIAALTALAAVVLVAPVPGVSDRVIYAAVIADLIAVGLIAGDVRGLWASVAFASCLCVAWYVFFFTTHADSGLLDGLILGVAALVLAGAAVGAGVLAGQLLRRVAR
ncbi:MAG TPA: hypothetical protein VI300_01260 [Solirubrobacter sp.]